MDNKLIAAAAKFAKFRDKLFAEYPEVSKDADDKADGIADCRTASVEQVWERMWDKPFYSVSKSADKLEEKLDRARPKLQSAWKHAMLKGPYFIEKEPIGHWMKTEAFVAGETLADLQTNYGLPYHRLLAAMSGGARLRQWESESKTPLAFILDKGSAEVDLAKVVPELQIALGKGKGWGHITVLHFLTDFGLACKPDLHVIRTMDALGLTSCESNKATLEEALAINEEVKQLLPRVYGRSASRRELRHMDKVLMEISQKKIFGETERDRKLKELAAADKARKEAEANAAAAS